MTAIDAYLEHVDPTQRTELERIRTIIRATVPDAEEVISYGIPVFQLRSKYLIGFAAFKHHMSLFPGAEAIETLKPKLTEYKLSRGTIQFTLDKPLSEAIIIQAIKIRLRSIAT